MVFRGVVERIRWKFVGFGSYFVIMRGKKNLFKKGVNIERVVVESRSREMRLRWNRWVRYGVLDFLFLLVSIVLVFLS